MTDHAAVLARWFRDRLPANRDLDQHELAALGGELAAKEELWQPLVRHDPDARFYAQLRRDHHVEVWLICWMPSQDVGLHDHDVSVGAVHVVEGAVAEERMVLGRGIETTEYLAGGSFVFDASRIHNVRHSGNGPATSIHLYSPPLWRMGYYELDGDGRLSRRSATYVEELRAS
ncbi:MAG TPA: cysteine dioxygenase family protein [Gaiellales bacterium]|jgi:hypothetical protein|nr:cysteine dioxygenase family protein [Gaiellales bacterium]